jgi:hypothetical protein
MKVSNAIIAPPARMHVRQHCIGSSLNDSPLTGEIGPPSDAVEATRLNPVVRRQAASRLTDIG